MLDQPGMSCNITRSIGARNRDQTRMNVERVMGTIWELPEYRMTRSQSHSAMDSGRAKGNSSPRGCRMARALSNETMPFWALCGGMVRVRERYGVTESKEDEAN